MADFQDTIPDVYSVLTSTLLPISRFTFAGATVTSTLQMRKLRLKGVKELAEDDITDKWERQDWNSGLSLTPCPELHSIYDMY